MTYRDLVQLDELILALPDRGNAGGTPPAAPAAGVRNADLRSGAGGPVGLPGGYGGLRRLVRPPSGAARSRRLGPAGVVGAPAGGGALPADRRISEVRVRLAKTRPCRHPAGAAVEIARRRRQCRRAGGPGIRPGRAAKDCHERIEKIRPAG